MGDERRRRRGKFGRKRGKSGRKKKERMFIYLIHAKQDDGKGWDEEGMRNEGGIKDRRMGSIEEA